MWNSRKPCMWKIVWVLVKKSLRHKLRMPSSILEFCFGLAVFMLVWPMYVFSRNTDVGLKNPPLNFSSSTSSELMKFFAYTEQPTVVGVPDNDCIRDLFAALIDRLDGLGKEEKKLIQRDKIQFAYASNVEEMKEIIYTSNSNAIGIEWINSDEDDRYTHPEVRLYTQFIGTLRADADVFNLLYWFISGEKHSKLNVAFMNTSLQTYAYPEKQEWISMAGGFTILLSVPVIFMTMAEIHILIEEKSSRVQMLSFLMGCPEAIYFTVSIFVQILMGWVGYVIVSVCMCYAFFFYNIDFWMFLGISLLFVISHVLFQMFVATLMRTSVSGRTLSVILIVVGVFFALLHSAFTLSETNAKPIVKHVFSVIPISSYQMATMALYRNALKCVPGIIKFNPDEFSDYPLLLGIEWLGIDAVVYLVLFILLNYFMPRKYGPRAFKCKCRCSGDSRIGSETNGCLEVHNLSKTYNGMEHPALSAASFSIDSNDIVAVVGPNGAGKSTLMNILMGSIKPSSGTVSIYGIQDATLSILQKYEGVCFQDNVIIEWLTIEEHFELFGTFRGLSNTQIRDSLDFFVDQLQLYETLNQQTRYISGGQKRKLCIALALLGSPPVAILDEPTAGIDLQSRRMIWKMISSMHETAVIITTHALEEAEAVSSRILVISEGKLVFNGSTTKLREQCNCGYILRVESESQEDVFTRVRDIIPDATRNSRNDTIRIPASKMVSRCIKMIEDESQKLGIKGFACYAENIEDLVLKLI